MALRRLNEVRRVSRVQLLVQERNEMWGEWEGCGRDDVENAVLFCLVAIGCCKKRARVCARCVPAVLSLRTGTGTVLYYSAPKRVLFWTVEVSWLVRSVCLLMTHFSRFSLTYESVRILVPYRESSRVGWVIGAWNTNGANKGVVAWNAVGKRSNLLSRHPSSKHKNRLTYNLNNRPKTKYCLQLLARSHQHSSTLEEPFFGGAYEHYFLHQRQWMNEPSPINLLPSLELAS